MDSFLIIIIFHPKEIKARTSKSESKAEKFDWLNSILIRNGPQTYKAIHPHSIHLSVYKNNWYTEIAVS